jgi:hypothetical protein
LACVSHEKPRISAWCGICALFPPRQYVDIGSVRDARLVPGHAFLFSPDFQVFHESGNYGYRYYVDVNGGRLLAELVLIVAATAVAFLFLEPVVRALKGLPPNKWFDKSWKP